MNNVLRGWFFGGPCGSMAECIENKNGGVQKTMHKDLPQRKIPVHYCVHDDGRKPAIVYVTVCTDKRKNILCGSNAHRLLLKAWAAANSWMVGRYMIMPDHIHFFCSPDALYPSGLEQWVQYWKAIVSREWSIPEERPLWQKSFWDTQLRSSDRYDEKWNYVLENPVRADLCAKSNDWPWQGELNVLEWC